MKRLFVHLFLGVLFLTMEPSVCFAQEGQISMTFAGKVGSEYKLLLMGVGNGSVRLIWGNGLTETKELRTNATAIEGHIEDQSLTIEGDIAVLECSGNDLLKLDVSKMIQLTDLTSRKNFHTELDLTRNESLKSLRIEDSPIASLDLSHCARLDSVICTNNNKLRSLILPQELPRLKKLILAACPFISSIDLKGMPLLEYLDLSEVGLSELDLSHNPELSYLSAGKSYMALISDLRLPSPNKLKTMIIPYLGISALDLSDSPLLETLVVSYSESMSDISLKGLKNLKVLDCQGCNLTKLNLEECPNLEELMCNNNKLSELNCSKKSNLKDVSCFANELKRIDFSECYSLLSLDCSYNKDLEEVHLSPSLQTLDISQCGLKEIPSINDLSRLKVLICGNNALTTLDLSAAYGLETLSCPNNNIKDLSGISQLSALKNITVSGNPISSLTLPYAYNIYYIKIDGTSLNACSLNALYRSLRERRDEDQTNDFGGCLIFNDTQEAPISNTDIAIKKGWGVSIEGDASGCPGENDQDFDVVYTNIAGNLYDDAPVEMWESATSIKIKGELNGTDLRAIRQLCGSDENASKIPHPRIRKLDLSEARIVPGGVYYIRVEDHGKIREYVVEEGTKDFLPDKLFYNCSSIESLTIPVNIREIGIGAFWQCINLQELKLPEEVIRINSTAFGVCNALKEFSLPRDLEYLGGYAFTYCANISEITIPEGVKILNKRLFDSCPKLTKVTLPKYMERFEPEAFLGAEALLSIEIPQGLTAIPASCFEGCRALREVTIPSTVTKIDDFAFQDNNSLETVNFSESLVSIGGSAFKNCRKIKNLSFPNNLEDIASEAFLNCEGVENIRFGTKLCNIGERAFWHCHGLKKLSLPISLQEIRYAAFAECMGLEQVDLNEATPQLEQNPFLGCLRLKTFTTSNGNNAYNTKDGILYSKDMKTLYAYPAGNASQSIILPEVLERIDDFAFWYATKLTEMTFPETLYQLGHVPFGGCSGLRRLRMLSTTPPTSDSDRDPFEEVDKSLCQLIVPKGSKAFYQQAPYWKDFNISEDTSSELISRAIIRQTADEFSWGFSNIPSSYHIAEIVDSSLRRLGKKTIVSGGVTFDHTHLPSGFYLIILGGVNQPCKVFKVGK